MDDGWMTSKALFCIRCVRAFTFIMRHPVTSSAQRRGGGSSSKKQRGGKEDTLYPTVSKLVFVASIVVATATDSRCKKSDHNPISSHKRNK